MHHKTSSLPNLYPKPPSFLKPSSDFGLVMSKHIFTKAQLKEPPLPSWLRPVQFKPKDAKFTTIDISDFYSQSDRLMIKKKYFSQDRVPRMPKKKDSSLKSLLFLTLSHEKKPVNHKNTGKNLSNLLRIESLKRKFPKIHLKK